MATDVDAKLLLRGFVALVTALAYAYVARLVVARKLEGDAVRANRAFAVWWISFGAIEFLVAGYQIPAAFGELDLALAVTFLNALVIMLAVALAGLLCFLVYLYTGSTRAFAPIAVAYAIVAAGLLYLVAWMQPDGFDPATGAIHYTRQLVGAPSAALGAVIALPVVLAAVGYASLYFRVTEREPRYRIVLVAGAFIVWFGWSLLSGVLGLARKAPDTVSVVNQVVALAAPLVIILAYQPPAAVRRWLARG